MVWLGTRKNVQIKIAAYIVRIKMVLFNGKTSLQEIPPKSQKISSEKTLIVCTSPMFFLSMAKSVVLNQAILIQAFTRI